MGPADRSRSAIPGALAEIRRRHGGRGNCPRPRQNENTHQGSAVPGPEVLEPETGKKGRVGFGRFFGWITGRATQTFNCACRRSLFMKSWFRQRTDAMNALDNLLSAQAK